MSTTLGGALAGIRVLDFSQVIFGPAATAVLADHGAEVFKVERPGAGDLARAFGPFLDGVSVSYASLNRNKKSLAVDLKSDAGMAIIWNLIPTVDVIVSNFRPGVMASLGLDYERVGAINPRIVYAVGTGFGSGGPLAESRKPGHDTVAQALGGAMWGNAGDDGVPRKIQLPVADMTAGNLLVQGILLALLARERTGEGQQVAVSLLDSLLWLEAWQVSSAANPTPDNQPRHGTNPLDGGIYRTSNGFIMVTALFRDQPLKDLCQAIGIRDLSTDERFGDGPSMARNAATLKAELSERFGGETTDHWMRRLERADFLASPVLSLDEAIEHPQVRHDEMIVGFPTGPATTQRHVGVPIKLTGTPGSIRRGAPAVGEHTEGILAEYGYSTEEIGALAASGIIQIGGAS